MGALSAIEAATVDEPEPAAVQVIDPQRGRRALRLVPRPDAEASTRPATLGGQQAQPRSSSIRAAARQPLTEAILTPSAVISPQSRPVTVQPPLRLTRRGRAVAATLVVALAAALTLVIALATAGGARAAGHGQPGDGHQGMHEIVVRPGQTLW